MDRTRIRRRSVTIFKRCTARKLTCSDIAGFDTLLTRDITKSMAQQRTGRAGREVSHSSSSIYHWLTLHWNRLRAFASVCTPRRLSMRYH